MDHVTKSELIERIEDLTDDEIERVAPYLEADLDALPRLHHLRDEVALGRKSAREEPLIDHAAVMDQVRAARRRR